MMFLLNSVIRAQYERFCIGYENVDPLQNVIPRSAVLGVDNLLVMGQFDVLRRRCRLETIWSEPFGQEQHAPPVQA